MRGGVAAWKEGGHARGSRGKSYGQCKGEGAHTGYEEGLAGADGSFGRQRLEEERGFDPLLKKLFSPPSGCRAHREQGKAKHWQEGGSVGWGEGVDRGRGRECWDLRSITFRNFDQNIKCSEKPLNRTFKIPRHQEQMILSSSMNEKNILIGFHEGVLEAIQVSSL